MKKEKKQDSKEAKQATHKKKLDLGENREKGNFKKRNQLKQIETSEAWHSSSENPGAWTSDTASQAETLRATVETPLASTHTL